MKFTEVDLIGPNRDGRHPRAGPEKRFVSAIPRSHRGFAPRRPGGNIVTIDWVNREGYDQDLRLVSALVDARFVLRRRAMRPVRGVEVVYRERIDRMSILERVQRSAELLAWSRGFVQRQLVAEDATLSGDRLKWAIALRQYGSDPAVRSMIRRMVEHASR